VLWKIGLDGTLYGEPGNGLYGGPITLTSYIWEYLGSACPATICSSVATTVLRPRSALGGSVERFSLDGRRLPATAQSSGLIFVHEKGSKAARLSLTP